MSMKMKKKMSPRILYRSLNVLPMNGLRPDSRLTMIEGNPVT